MPFAREMVNDLSKTFRQNLESYGIDATLYFGFIESNEPGKHGHYYAVFKVQDGQSLNYAGVKAAWDDTLDELIHASKVHPETKSRRKMF